MTCAHLLVKLPCVTAEGVICASMVLSTKLAKRSYSNWLATSHMLHTRAKQWTLLDLWILNPFSPTGLQPGCFHRVNHRPCSACTIGSCVGRSNSAIWGFGGQGWRATVLLPPHLLAMAFVGHLAAWHIGSPWLLASSWPKARRFKALEALKMFGPKDMNKTMVCTWSILVI